MNVSLEWATYPRLIERPFFEASMALYFLEKELGTPIQDSVHWTRRFEYPWILSNLEASEKVLDVGAGATALQFMIARRGAFVTSADVDSKAVGWINGRTENQLVKNPKAMPGGLPNLPFLAGSFETVVCVSVLEHLPKGSLRNSIMELARVSSRDVLITMDVSLTRNDRQADQDDLAATARELGFQWPEIGRYAMSFRMDGVEFVVACMRIRK